MQRALTIDGSIGEGGGQMLRTSISLSAILKIPIEINNIRAKRPNPGLRPQHLSAVKSVAELFSAKVENLQLGADWIRFHPSDKFNPPSNPLDIGTAGSIPLVLLTLIPAVALSGNSLELEIIGGTDVKASPTLDYIRFVALAAYRMIGIRFEIEVKKRGYYPKGGGRVKVKISRCSSPQPVELLDMRISEPNVHSVCSGLPNHVADRQISSAIAAIEKAGMRCRICSSSIETSHSPGTSVLVYSTSEYGSFRGGDCIGERGKPAETVGREAANRFIDVTCTPAAVDPFLADMLVIPLSLCKGLSRYHASRITSHLTTNLELASQFTGCQYSIDKQERRSEGIVEIRG